MFVVCLRTPIYGSLLLLPELALPSAAWTTWFRSSEKQKNKYHYDKSAADDNTYLVILLFTCPDSLSHWVFTCRKIRQETISGTLLKAHKY
jgi:hypothetical protein